MLQWLADNIEGIKAVFVIVGCIATVVIPMLVKLGWIRAQTADAAIVAIETVKGAVIRVSQEFEKLNGRAPTVEELAALVDKSVKREATEQALRSGVKAVVGDLKDRAANADPKEEKQPRRPLLRLLALIRPKVLGG